MSLEMKSSVESHGRQFLLNCQSLKQDDPEILLAKFNKEWQSIFTNEFCRINDYFKRGCSSVKNVGLALYQVPEIVYIRIVKPFSKEDIRQKKDLAIYIANPSKQGCFSEIGIQVKSSDRFALDFLLEINNEQDKVWPELAKRKLILINGQRPEEKIREDFNTQLKDIINY